MIFKPWGEKQERAILSKGRITLFAAGTQAGKTTVGGLRMRLKMLNNPGPENAYLITAPTYKILSQSTLPAFLGFMQGLGKYNKKDDIFELTQGARCYCRTETDPDSIVGITNIRHIWCDEAGKYRLYFWENIQARADFLGASIDLTTSPYSLNWIHKEIIKPVLKGTRHDVELVQAASWENPYHSLFDPVKRQEKKNTMDARRFNMIYGGQWDRMEGLVYDCWDEQENIVDAFGLPTGTRFYGGIDWGFYPDPFVLLVRAVTPEGRHYGISEFVKTRLTLPDIVRLLKTKKTIFGIEKFFCDPSNPGGIEELNRNGLPAMGADNGIRLGIDTHYELIKMRLYKEFKGACPHTADERETYHYPDEKELGPDQNAKELLPVDARNHCFVGDTLITTARGLVPIRDIVIGDKVETRSGLKRVLKVWDNGFKPVMELRFSNGSMLRCTDQHGIYTKNRGFVPADSLTGRDTLVTVSEWQKKKLYSKVDGSEEIPIQLEKTIEITTGVLQYTLKKALDICIEKYGKGPSVKSLRDFMSITKTEIPLIMRSPTSNAFIKRRIIKTTKPRDKEIRLSLIGKENIFQRLEIKQKNGMLRKLATNGTSSMGLAVPRSAKESPLTQFANNVKIHLKQIQFALSQVFQSFVQIIVNQPVENKVALTTFQGIVSNVTLRYESINTPKLGSVQQPVLLLQDEVRVYDLTIEDTPEYFANGILVHNCMDASRYLSISLHRSGIKHTPIVPSEVSKPRVGELPFERLQRIRKDKSKEKGERWS